MVQLNNIQQRGVYIKKAMILKKGTTVSQP